LLLDICDGVGRINESVERAVRESEARGLKKHIGETMKGVVIVNAVHMQQVHVCADDVIDVRRMRFAGDRVYLIDHVEGLDLRVLHVYRLRKHFRKHGLCTRVVKDVEELSGDDGRATQRALGLRHLREASFVKVVATRLESRDGLARSRSRARAHRAQTYRALLATLEALEVRLAYVRVTVFEASAIAAGLAVDALERAMDARHVDDDGDATGCVTALDSKGFFKSKRVRVITWVEFGRRRRNQKFSAWRRKNSTQVQGL